MSYIIDGYIKDQAIHNVGVGLMPTRLWDTAYKKLKGNSMKRINILWFFGVLFLASTNVSALEWQNDIDKAFQQAKTENKAVLAFFYHYLYYQNPGRQREDFLVWESPLVQKYISYYIPVKVNVEGKDDIESKYGVLSFPTVLFFDPQGRELKPMSIREKSLNKNTIAVRMKQVLENIDEFSLIEQQVKTDSNNPKFSLLYANGLRDRGLYDQAEEQYYRLMNGKNLDAALLAEVKTNYTNMLFYQGSNDFYSGRFDRCIETMQRFIAKNPTNEAVPQAKMLMGMSLCQVNRKDEGEKTLKELLRDKNAAPLHKEVQYFLNEKNGGKKR